MRHLLVASTLLGPLVTVAAAHAADPTVRDVPAPADLAPYEEPARERTGITIDVFFGAPPTPAIS